jgi:hypothetical protein
MNRSRPRHALHLPNPGGPGREVFRTPRRPSRQLLLLQSLASVALGVGLLTVLLHLPERLVTLLLLSSALSGLIAGLRQAGLALLQLLGLVLLVLLTLLALALVVGGSVRLIRALLQAPRRRRPRSR